MLPNLSATGQVGSFRFLLACILSHIIVAEGLTLTSLSHKLPASELLFDTVSYVSPGLVYGSCTKIPSDKNHQHCTFAMETNSNVGTPDHLHFCNFTSSAYNKTNGFERDYVVAIDENKAVVVRNGYGDLHELSILDFSDCRVGHVTLVDGISLEVEAPANGLFEVVSRFRTVIDFHGNIVTGRQPDWIYNERTFRNNVVIRSPLKGHLAVTSNLRYNRSTNPRLIRAIQVFTIKNKGKPEVVKEYSLDDRDFSRERLAVSSTHQLLSVCVGNTLTIFCWQFDHNGKQKFETNLTVTESWNNYFFKVHNLREGGFLILLFRCRTHDEFGLCLKPQEDYFTVIEIDKTGRLAGSLQVSQFSDSSKSEIDTIHFFENERNEMCLSMVIHRDLFEKGQVTLRVVCFKDEELSA